MKFISNLMALLVVVSLASQSSAECPDAYSIVQVPGGLFGTSVSGIGNINGGFLDDFIVGASDDGNGDGKAFVYSGDGTFIRSHTDPVNWGASRFGFSVSGAGDFDMDGIPDYIIGAYNAAIFSGGPQAGGFAVHSGIDGDLIFDTLGFVSDSLGFSVANAGDVNNDGWDDVIVGAPGHVLFNGIDEDEGVGKVIVYGGRFHDALYTFFGDHPAQGFGFDVANAGDVDGDGRDDFLIASKDGSPIKVYSGMTGSEMQDLNIPGTTYDGGVSYDGAPKRIDGVGDIDSDGFDDFVVGYIHLNKAVVYSGEDGTILLTLDTISSQFMGHQVAAGGLITGDNTPDILVTDEEGVDGFSRVYVFSGATGGVSLTIMRNTPGIETYGDGLASAGDTDNDGIDDILIGQPALGKVWVHPCQDTDNDEILDIHDNCPTIPNNDQLNQDTDGLGDACDNCDLVSNPGQENCDPDNLGNACDDCTDSDEDGLGNPGFGNTNCPGADDDCPAMPSSEGELCCSTVDGWAETYAPGDVNQDGVGGNIIDLTFLVDYIFRGGPAPSPFHAGEVNCDCSPSNIGDLTFLVDYIFRGGPMPCDVRDCYREGNCNPTSGPGGCDPLGCIPTS
ncbi:MAG: FG-GAP repeat protein [candidate division Zixibacteria bacterium]|nr:FG-GAP repeat protein [candidate division Zixibacteria bacterium]